MKFSLLKADNIFSDILGATALAVISKYLTVDEIAESNIEDLVNFIVKKVKDRFDNQAELAKYADLVWLQYQSGLFEVKNTRLIKSGNRYHLI